MLSSSWQFESQDYINIARLDELICEYFYYRNKLLKL